MLLRSCSGSPGKADLSCDLNHQSRRKISGVYSEERQWCGCRSARPKWSGHDAQYSAMFMNVVTVPAGDEGLLWYDNNYTHRIFDFRRRNTTTVTQYYVEWSGFSLSQGLSTLLLKALRCGRSVLDTTLQKAFRLFWNCVLRAINLATRYFYRE